MDHCSRQPWPTHTTNKNTIPPTTKNATPLSHQQRRQCSSMDNKATHRRRQRYPTTNHTIATPATTTQRHWPCQCNATRDANATPPGWTITLSNQRGQERHLPTSDNSNTLRLTTTTLSYRRNQNYPTTNTQPHHDANAHPPMESLPSSISILLTLFLSSFACR